MANSLYTSALARLDAWDGDGEASVISALLRALLVERRERENYRGFEPTDRIAEAIGKVNESIRRFVEDSDGQ